MVENTDTHKHKHSSSLGLKDNSDIVESGQNSHFVNLNKADYTNYEYIAESDVDRAIVMKDQHIWKGFPLKDRFLMWFCCGSPCLYDTKQKRLFIEDIIQTNYQIDKRVLELLANKILHLKILKTGMLDVEGNIIHPFVRINFLNLKTGRYLQKQEFDKKLFSQYEKLVKATNKSTKESTNYEYFEGNLDYIQPLSTCPYDLRQKGESYAEWNEEFIIDEDINSIFKPYVVIIFELLDYDIYSKLKLSQAVDELGIVKIAWGYLLPIGLSQTYIGDKFKIQLYKYKYSEPYKMIKKLRSQNKIELRRPNVLYDFNWFKKEKYSTYLEIELRLGSKHTESEIMNQGFLMNLFKYTALVTENPGFDRKKFLELLRAGKKKIKTDELDTKDQERRHKLLRRKRNLGEKCMLPDKLIYKLEADKLGCLTAAISPDGKYIACACTEISSLTKIKIYSLEDGLIKYIFKGHQNLIHSFKWTRDSLILFSASSDGIVSIWGIPREESNSQDNLDYLDNSSIFNLQQIQHPSYVYDISMYQTYDKDTLVFATACFDGIVRIYLVILREIDQATAFSVKSCDNIKFFNISNEFLSSDFKPSNKKYFKPNASMSETLKQFFNPEKGEEAELLKKTVFDHRHPNSLDFDENGRLYVGDSLGAIHIWDLRISNNKADLTKIRIVTHKELEGDTINHIYLEPINKRRLIVHTRDNCIRLIDIKDDKVIIVVRYYGHQNCKTNIKSTVSPDGEYIASGSEQGKPYMWSLLTGFQENTDIYQIGFYDPVSDISWSENYNVFAISSFGQEYPILVYAHEKEIITIDPYDLKIKDANQIINREEDHLKDEKSLITPAKENISEYSKEYKTTIEPLVKDFRH